MFSIVFQRFFILSMLYTCMRRRRM